MFFVGAGAAQTLAAFCADSVPRLMCRYTRTTSFCAPGASGAGAAVAFATVVASISTS
jgi:hypothetical protein